MDTYRIDFLSYAGVKYAEVSDFEQFACVLKVNDPGILQVKVDGSHSVLSSLAHLDQVQLWRKNTALGVSWYKVFGGLYEDDHRERDETSHVTLSIPEYKKMLSWRIVNWSADTSNKSKFVSAKAETIMKTLVRYNATSDATTGNGRKRNGAITGVTYATDTAAGNTLDWYCFGKNLLDTLQELALVAGGDFDLVQTAAQAWEFRWYTGQLGTDRTATVKFAVELGNMGHLVYDRKRSKEATVACVWGQDSGANREYVTRTGTNYSSGVNDKELFIDARDVASGVTAGLNARGDQKLYEAQSRDEFTFKVLQTPACQFGVHYFLGDKVTVRNYFTQAEVTQKIMSVSLAMGSDGTQTIEVEPKTP